MDTNVVPEERNGEMIFVLERDVQTGEELYMVRLLPMFDIKVTVTISCPAASKEYVCMHAYVMYINS
jgi:hypothetical protein